MSINPDYGPDNAEMAAFAVSATAVGFEFARWLPAIHVKNTFCILFLVFFTTVYSLNYLLVDNYFRVPTWITTTTHRHLYVRTHYSPPL